MAGKNYIDKYIEYFSVQTGRAPKRDRLEWAINETLNDDDLKLFFVLPQIGSLTPQQFRKKAIQKGFTDEVYQQCLTRLHEEGFVISHDIGIKGRVYERAFVSFTLEQQVRRKKGTELGAAYGEFWESMAAMTAKLPTKTPYFRVLPVEATLTGQAQTQVISVGVEIPDPRQVLPIDVISQMVSKEPLIGISECYCRLARENRGGGECEYPRETCFTFNELAQTLIETNLARKIEAEEAIRILRNAEEHRLIHNVDNCQGHLKALCNCCPDCCPAIKSFKAGVRNVNSASRYMAYWIEEKCTECGVCVEVCPVEAITSSNGNPTFHDEQCIGCGLCVSNCPEGAIKMVLREVQPNIPVTNTQLWSRIRNEAIVTLVKEKVTGIFK